MPDEEKPENDEQKNQPEATEQDLGVRRDAESGRIEADFDSVIDAVVREKGIVTDQAPAEKKSEAAASKPPEDAEKKEGDEKPASDDKPAADKDDATKSDAAEPGEKTTDKPASSHPDLDEMAAGIDPHAKPATRKHFDAMRTKVEDARAEATREKTRAEELAREVEEMKKRTVPKEVEEELNQLREVVRATDAARDPAIVAKYDKRIQANENKVINILKDHGFGVDDSGKEKPGVIDNLRKQGINRRTLSDKIKALRDAKQDEDADEIEAILRDNNNLTHDKQNEVETLKAGHETRVKQREEESKQRQEADSRAMVASFTKEVSKYDFLKQPPAVDTKAEPGIQKQQAAAISAFNERVSRMSETIKSELKTDLGINTAARVGVLLRDHVVPHYQTRIADLEKQLAAAESKIKGFKAAGDLANKGGTSKPRPPAETDVDPNTSFDDAVDSAARKAGFIK